MFHENTEDEHADHNVRQLPGYKSIPIDDFMF